MTDIIKKEIPLPIGNNGTNTLLKLVEAVNQLQGTTDQDQRAVRIFEFEQRVAAIEARLKAAGY